MFLGWASRSNNGRWFSRKSRGSPPVWVMGAGARGPAQGCRAVVDGVVGEARRGEARRRRGKAKVRQAERKAGMCVYVGGGGQQQETLVRAVGENGMFHKKPSPPCSVRMRASAVGVAAQTTAGQQGSSRVTVILSHTFSTV